MNTLQDYEKTYLDLNKSSENKYIKGNELEGDYKTDVKCYYENNDLYAIKLYTSENIIIKFVYLYYKRSNYYKKFLAQNRLININVERI